ncbi:MAG: putative Multi-sensor hybrid histidine kinase [Nitrospira sp.]|nr:putative Multi-sensor hybrid histidine kinase [Nitrospira sp.]
MAEGNPEDRILILAPIGQDATAMARLLRTHGFVGTVCESAADACRYLMEGAGVLLVTEEALELPQMPELLHELNAQPPWSELPLIVLTRGGESRLARLLHHVAQAAGSLTLLERPLGEATLLRSVEVALRARRRQYQVRDLLAQQRIVHKELRESEEKYRSLFESIDQGFCTLEVLFDEHDEPVDYRFLSINPCFERQTGIADAVGRRIRELFPLHEDYWFQTYGKIAKTGESMRFEREAAQLHRHYEVFAWRVGEPAERKVAVLFNDISERKRTEAALRESEERLSLAMAAASMGAWDMDLQRGSLVWDARQPEIFGRSVQTAPKTAEDFYKLVHPQDVDRIKRATEAANQSGHFSEEFRIVGEDGAVRWIAGHGVIVTDSAGRPARMVGVNYDITDTKAAQARLEQFAEELERLVSERTHELRSSQGQLRALATELNLAEQRERKRIAAEMHDHLAQMLVLVRLKLGQAKQGPVHRSLEMMKQAEDVVNDALTYTRNLVAELSPPVLHEFGLFAAFRWLAEQMQRYQLQVTVQIDAAGDLRLPEDQAVLMFQSVRELLMNAVKHAVAKQAFLLVEEQEGALQIIVEDQGVGFDLLAMATQQPSPLSSKFGLFSIRERMNAMGGRLELHSVPGDGTRATLILPCAPRQQASVEPPSKVSFLGAPASISQNRLHGPCRVLIADDHAMVREGLRSVLEGFPDIDVIGEASNGQEAIDLTERFKPAAIVMDINMPLINGIEATARIKTRHPEIVVIGMSVNASADNHDAMRTAGASMLLTKEAAVDQLHGAIQRAVREIGAPGRDALGKSR